MPESRQTSDWRGSVLLRHDVSGVGAHVDWMIAPANPASTDERVLVTWRIDEATGRALADGIPPVAGFDAVRIADHRYRYLDYEGEVSGGRGRVCRLSQGRVRVFESSPWRFDVEVEFGSAVRVLGERIGDAPEQRDDGDPPRGLWRFGVVTRSSDGG